MTQEDMIRMAKEAGWQYAHGDSGYEPLWEFAALVASAEREACEALCKWRTGIQQVDAAIDTCAAAIRARQ